MPQPADFGQYGFPDHPGQGSLVGGTGTYYDPSVRGQVNPTGTAAYNHYGVAAATGGGFFGQVGTPTQSIPGAGNPYNQGALLPSYGGYGNGFSDTMAMEGRLAQQAQNQKAASANFGQANNLFGVENAYGKQQSQLGKQMGTQAAAMRALASGKGATAADYGIPGQQSANIAAAQAAAAGGGNPLAARAAAAGMGAANLGVSSGFGSDVAGTMQAGQQGLTGALGAQVGLYGQQGGQDIGASQLAAQQAQFNPTLQAEQNKTNDAAALGYTNAGLSLQGNEQNIQNQAWADENQYALGQQGLSNQQTNQIVGGFTTGLGITAAAL